MVLMIVKKSWLLYPHCCPGARDLTVVWGWNRGGGGRANTQSGG